MSRRKQAQTHHRRPHGFLALCYNGGFGCMEPLDIPAMNQLHAQGQDYIHTCGRRIPPYGRTKDRP